MHSTNQAAKFAFYYLLSLVALIFMSLASGMIIFQIINKNVPDILNQYSGRFSPQQLKFALSALIISAPIFYLTNYQIYRALFKGELNKDSGVRRWLVYLILFVSSVVMIGWLIATVNNFLDGELTKKFILKSITAIGIAVSIFVFYLYDIKREKVAGEKNRFIQVYFYISLAAVIAIFIASLFFVESPREARNRKLDNLILDNFNVIENAVANYYEENGRIPPNLEILKNEFSYLNEKKLKDPVTGQQFEYKVSGPRTYKLCATFRTDNRQNNDWRAERWPHGAGYQCLPIKVRDFGKPIPPVKRSD
jgi:type II secretory pathway pseudopilin PulG